MSYRNVFQIGINALSKMVLKKPIFFFFFLIKKLKISCSLAHTILFKFHLHGVQTFLKKCMGGLKTFNLEHMLVKFEENRMVRTEQNLNFFFS